MGRLWTFESKGNWLGRLFTPRSQFKLTSTKPYGRRHKIVQKTPLSWHVQVRQLLSKACTVGYLH
jgi:hypothetical protein